MSALLLGLLQSPTLLAILGGIVATVAALMRGRVQGAKREREKIAAEELKARDDFTEIQSDVGVLRDAEAREELAKWGR